MWVLLRPRCFERGEMSVGNLFQNSIVTNAAVPRFTADIRACSITITMARPAPLVAPYRDGDSRSYTQPKGIKNKK
jgi:hypothetical protein